MREKDCLAEVFEYSSHIRGYHAYLDIWTPVIGKPIIENLVTRKTQRQWR